MIYPDMPIPTNVIWLIAFLVVVAGGIMLLAIYGATKRFEGEQVLQLSALVLPIVFGMAVTVSGALVYSGVVYDLLVHGAIVDALHGAGYQNVDLTDDHFTAMQGDNQVTAGLIPAGPGAYGIEVFMSGPVYQEES